MNFLIKIWIAFILDLIFGDPEKITHPVQIIGKMIIFLEKKLYGKKGSFIGGAILTILVVGSTFLIMYGFVELTKIVKVLEIFEIYLMYTVFSIKSLAREGKKVYKRTGTVHRSEYESEEISLLISTSPIEIDNEMCILLSIDDVTEAHLSEKKIMEQNEELQRNNELLHQHTRDLILLTENLDEINKFQKT